MYNLKFNSIFEKSISIILPILVIFLLNSCSSVFYDYDQRVNNNRVSISNNLNERVNIVCKENGKTTSTYYNPNTKLTETKLIFLKPKHTLLIFSENTDTVELKIKKVPRTRAVIQNALATPFMFGVNWLFEIGNPNYFKVHKYSKEIKISNLRYNHKFIENKFTLAFTNYNRDTILNYLQVYDYYIGLENIKSNIDSIEYDKIKNSTDTNQYNQYYIRALTSEYKNIVDEKIRLFRNIKSFCDNNKNSDSEKIKDYLNKIKTSSFSFWVEELYLSKWDNELKSRRDIDEMIEFLKYLNNVNNSNKFTDATFVNNKTRRYAFLISRSVKDKLTKSINENIDYLFKLDSLVFFLEKENVLPRNFIDSTKENLKVAFLNRIVSDINKCKNHECQFKTFYLIKNRAHYRPVEKNLDLYIFNNLATMSNVNEIDLYYPVNEVSGLIEEVPSKYFETHQFLNMTKQPYRICLSKIKNDKGDFKYYEKRIFNKENILVMKVESLDFKYFDTKNYYFHNKRLVGIQYLYKNETNGSYSKAASFAIDEKGVVANNKNIIKTIDDYFKDKKSFDSMSVSQLQIYKNQIKEVRLDLDTIWEIPELMSVKNHMNNLEIKINKSIAKNEAKEQLLRDQFKNKLTTVIKLEKSIPTAIVQKRLDRVEKNEYGQIVKEYYKYAFVDSRTNSLIGAFIYDGIEYIPELNRFYVEINGKYGMVNAAGATVIPTVYGKIEYRSFAINGYARCFVTQPANEGLAASLMTPLLVEVGSVYNDIIDLFGKSIFTSNENQTIGPWVDEKSFLVTKNRKVGVFTTELIPLINCVFDQLICINHLLIGGMGLPNTQYWFENSDQYKFIDASKYLGYSFLGLRASSSGNIIDEINDDKVVVKSHNINANYYLKENSIFIFNETMFFSLVNSMIPLSDIGGKKTNYFITNNNQYLFNADSGLYVTERFLFDPSNVRNSKIFILQSNSIRGHGGWANSEGIDFNDKFDESIANINLYKNNQKITGEELLTKCGCLRLGVARSTGSGSVGFEGRGKIEWKDGKLPFNPILNSRWEKDQQITGHLEISCITSYEYQYSKPSPIYTTFKIQLNDL